MYGFLTGRPFIVFILGHERAECGCVFLLAFRELDAGSASVENKFALSLTAYLINSALRFCTAHRLGFHLKAGSHPLRWKHFRIHLKYI